MKSDCAREHLCEAALTASEMPSCVLINMLGRMSHLQHMPQFGYCCTATKQGTELPYSNACRSGMGDSFMSLSDPGVFSIASVQCPQLFCAARQVNCLRNPGSSIPAHERFIDCITACAIILEKRFAINAYTHEAFLGALALVSGTVKAQAPQDQLFRKEVDHEMIDLKGVLKS